MIRLLLKIRLKAATVVSESWVLGYECMLSIYTTTKYYQQQLRPASQYVKTIKICTFRLLVWRHPSTCSLYAPLRVWWMELHEFGVMQFVRAFNISSSAR